MTAFDPKSAEIIGGDADNLWVSLDYDDDPEKAHPVFLFTPRMSNTGDHHHIELTTEQAARLREWLNQNI